ncbi:MAG: hypothetical protein RBS53_05925 [Bacteroidales bacterium]|nr:hypothetical protein [Bacteroidales bacterium]NLM92097.1 hypothetical protein [Bacteroidales bacterium]
MKKMMLGFATLIMAVVMISCNKVPQLAIDNATAAVEALKTVEADRYLASEFTAINDSLTTVMAAIEAEKTGAKNFKPLTEKLEWIATTAETMKADAETRKAEVRTEVENVLAGLTTMVGQEKDLLGKVNINNRNRTAIETIQNEITVLESAVSEVNTLVSNGDYLTALEKVNVAQIKATSIHNDLMAFAPAN